MLLCSWILNKNAEGRITVAEKETLKNEATAVNPADDIQQEIPEEIGDIRIADEVISIVASLAAQEVPGVLRMSAGLTDGLNSLLGKPTTSKGVKLSFDGKQVIVNVYLVMEYGYCIPEVALVVQEKVKDAIETMTGYEVQFVDVTIEGVGKREKSKLEQEVEADESMADLMRAQAKRAEATENTSFEMQLANLEEERFLESQEEERHKRFLEED